METTRRAKAALAVASPHLAFVAASLVCYSLANRFLTQVPVTPPQSMSPVQVEPSAADPSAQIETLELFTR